MLLETRHHCLYLETLEVRGQARANLGQQAFEDVVCAVSSSAV
jgi:hypothetical protein